ncbi:MAG: TetR/AcrR family transcriptional regulator [Methanobacterium sp.]
MTKETEEQIMDTALKMFAERSYLGAKTKSIAEEAGFSEMTLFRKFKTKKNLYDMVMKKNQEKLLKEFQTLFREDQSGNAEEFLKSLVKNVMFLMENNFEYIVISIHEGPEQSESGDLNSFLIKGLGEYIQSQEVSKNAYIDFEIFAFNIATFIYFIVTDKKFGKLFNNHEEVVDKFISYSARCLEY